MKLSATSIIVLAITAEMCKCRMHAAVAPELGVLKRFVGTWKVEQTRKTEEDRRWPCGQIDRDDDVEVHAGMTISEWSDEGVMKAAVWTTKEIRFKGESEKLWFLEGKSGKSIFQQTEKAIFLHTYSPADRAVRMWHFNAAGYVHEWIGDWDDDKQTLTLPSNLDGHPTVSGVLTHTVTGKDTIEWSAIATDKAGRSIITSKARRSAEVTCASRRPPRSVRRSSSIQRP